MKLEEAIELLKKYVAACNGTLPMAFSRRTLKEAIDTVVAELEKPLPTDEQIEAYALENILESDSIMGFGEMQRWIAGATWMRDLIQERSKNEQRRINS